MQGEVDKTIKQLVDNIPEKIRQEVHDRLMVAFNIRPLQDFPYLKKMLIQTLPSGKMMGRRWNKIDKWYLCF